MILPTHDDTIVAIASPLTPAHRGIVRLSGATVVSILDRVQLLPGGAVQTHPERFSSVVQLSAALGEIDVDVLLWPTHRSYTGQPSAELHLIGSLPILDAMVERLIQAGARAARAGEFTMRSFLAGRLDLPQAEAVLGVIDAEDRSTLDHALAQLAGNLSRPLQTARNDLLDLLADVEAGLDFVDEDIEFIEDAVLIDRLGGIASLLSRTNEQLRERSSSHSSFEVVLRGLPNAGKSCLLNALSQTDSAIVTDQAGTTRDRISISCEIDGYPIRVTDTAGIEHRDVADPEAGVSLKAQQQAADAASRADLCLWCVDASELTSQQAHQGLRFMQAANDAPKRSTEQWVLLTKSDLIDQRFEGTERLVEAATKTMWISTRSGDGMETLQREIALAAERLDATEVGSVIGTAARCRGSLHGAIESIQRAIEMTRATIGHELVAAEIRAAAQFVGEVTGEVYTDDLLDRVFSRFCIGK